MFMTSPPHGEGQGWLIRATVANRPEVVPGAGRRVTLSAAGTVGTLQAAQKAVIMVFTNSTAK